MRQRIEPRIGKSSCHILLLAVFFFARISPPEIRCPESQCFRSSVIAASESEFLCSRIPSDCKSALLLRGFTKDEEEEEEGEGGVGGRFGGGSPSSVAAKGQGGNVDHVPPAQRIKMNVGGYLVIGMGLVVFSTVVLIGCAKVR